MWLGGLGETGRGEFGGFWFLYMQFWIDLGCYQGYNISLQGFLLVLCCLGLNLLYSRIC